MTDLTTTERTRNLFGQLTSYSYIGIASNLAGYFIYLLVTYLGGTPKITMSILYGVGTVIGFIGNRQLTFRHTGNLLVSALRYVIAHCFGYFINLMILIVFVDKIGYDHRLVQAIAIFVVAAFLFLTFKFFVFTDKNTSNVGGQ